MGHRTTVLLLIPHLGGGGAEKVIAQLAGGLDPSKYALHLCVVYPPVAKCNSLPPHVTVHSLNSRRVRWSALPLVRLVRTVQPDIIVSGMANLSAMVLLLRRSFPSKTRIIARQNGSVSESSSSLLFRGLYRRLYPKADAVVCQSRAMAEDIQRAGRSSMRVCVLPNPVDVDGIRGCNQPAMHWAGPGPHLLAIGRLAPEKGFDILLQAFQLVRDEYPTADLAILGDGAERRYLERVARRLGIESCMRFCGAVSRPENWFSGANVFVLSSRHDALPNALLEAAAAGLPIVTTRASEGLAGLLEGDPGVWMAPETSVDGLYAALRQALAAIEPGQRYPHGWVNGFRSSEALQQWEHFLDDMVCRSGR